LTSERHLTAEEVRGWHSRSLSGEETLAASDHVARCAECAVALTGPHTPERVASFLEQSLGAEHTASKSAACDYCRAEAEDLASFSAMDPHPSGNRRGGFWAFLAAGIAAMALVALFVVRPRSTPVAA